MREQCASCTELTGKLHRITYQQMGVMRFFESEGIDDQRVNALQEGELTGLSGAQLSL